MQLAIRPYAAAVVVAVIGAGLIDVTPVARNLEQRSVRLSSIEIFSDLIGPVDATLGSLTAVSGSALASVTEALTSSGEALSAASGDALSNLAELDIPPLLDPAFWQAFWDLLADDPGNAFWMLLTQLPVVGPAVLLFDIFVLLPLASLFGSWWTSISDAFGLDALPAAISTAVMDVGSGFSDVAGALDVASNSFDPSVLTSVLDLSPIADIGAAVDPSAVADMGTALSTTIPGVAEVLTSLVP